MNINGFRVDVKQFRFDMNAAETDVDWDLSTLDLFQIEAVLAGDRLSVVTVRLQQQPYLGRRGCLVFRVASLVVQLQRRAQPVFRIPIDLFLRRDIVQP